MNIFTVTFFGHRHIDDHRTVELKLEKLIRRFIDENTYVDFLVGRNGDFDQLVASTVRRVKKNHRADNSSLVLVLPYITEDLQNNRDGYEAYYDDIEICENSASAHFKAAHTLRNRYLADRADLIVAYTEHPNGGAYTAVKYAKHIGKRIIDLSDDCCLP